MSRRVIIAGAPGEGEQTLTFVRHVASGVKRGLPRNRRNTVQRCVRWLRRNRIVAGREIQRANVAASGQEGQCRLPTALELPPGWPRDRFKSTCRPGVWRLGVISFSLAVSPTPMNAMNNKNRLWVDAGLYLEAFCDRADRFHRRTCLHVDLMRGNSMYWWLTPQNSLSVPGSDTFSQSTVEM